MLYNGDVVVFNTLELQNKTRETPLHIWEHLQICVVSCVTFFSSRQGLTGEKGTSASGDIIDFNGKLLDAFQVSCEFNGNC